MGGNAQPWQQAWQDALYGERGFYRRSAPADHFATSAQGVPGGGALLAEAVVALARRHGRTRLVDVGAGRGELLASVRALAPDLHLTGVDVVPAPPALEVDDWLAADGGAGLPAALTGLTDALVLAHEWLDVVPCPVVERDGDGVWRELAVDRSGAEVLGRPLADHELAWARRWLPARTTRAEVGLPRDRALADLLGRVRSGTVVAVDYGHTRADRPAHGTLTGFRHGRQVSPVPDGSCDLTAHVAVDSLVAAAATGDRARSSVRRQRDALMDLLPDPDPAAPVPHELARREPAAYLGSLARRGALATLTARGGLGDFLWVVAVVGPGA